MRGHRWDGGIFHYIHDDKLKNQIMWDSRLRPCNKTLDYNMTKRYAERAFVEKLSDASRDKTNVENARLYWKHAYDYFYLNVVKKPYKNYGIYMTTIDLFEAGLGDFKYRLRLSYKYNLRGKTNTVIQIGRDVKKVSSERHIAVIANKYTNPSQVQKLYKKSKFPYKYLPQVVNFSDYIDIDRSMLEKRPTPAVKSIDDGWIGSGVDGGTFK